MTVDVWTRRRVGAGYRSQTPIVRSLLFFTLVTLPYRDGSVNAASPKPVARPIQSDDSKLPGDHDLGFQTNLTGVVRSGGRSILAFEQTYGQALLLGAPPPSIFLLWLGHSDHGCML